MSDCDSVYVYAIVEFDELIHSQKSVELVPISWLYNDDTCYYPNKQYYKNIEQWIKQQRAPEKNWPLYRISIISKAEDYDQGIRRLERSFNTKNVNTSEDSESQLKSKKSTIVLKSSAVTKALSTPRPLFKKKTLMQIKEKVYMPEEDDDSHDEERVSNDDERDERENSNGKTFELGTPSRSNSNKDSADLAEVVSDLKNFIQSEMYKMKRSIMYEIKQSVDEIKAIVATQHPDEPNRPHYWQVFGTDLPFDELQQFLEFETTLISDDSKQNALKDVFRLATVGSNNYINDVAAIIKKIITKTVQLEYSGCGRKVLGTGKRSFKNTQVFKFMSDFLILKYEKSGEKLKLLTAASNFLSGAKDREGGRAQREKKAQIQQS